jgi:hypothetical protein
MKLMLKVGVLAIFSAGALISVDAMLEQQSQCKYHSKSKMYGISQ